MEHLNEIDRGANMRRDHDAQPGWVYTETGERSGGPHSSGPLWAPPDMEHGRRLADAARYYGRIVLILLVFIGSVGGAVYVYMSSADDSAGLDAEELDELMAAHQSGGTEDASSSAVATSAPLNATTLSVFSDPPNATVLIDYDSVGATPLRNHSILPGVYILSVADGSDVRLDTVIVVREGGRAGALSIEVESGEVVRPSTDEQFASITDEAARVTPRQSQEAPATGEMAESPPQQSEAAEQPPAPVEEESRPQPPRERAATYGVLSVSSAPSGAEVQIDGKRAGVTPLHIQEISTGSRRISIHMDGYETASAVVDIEPGRLASVHETLEGGSGTIKVLVRPWGTIYIDGELHGRDLDVQYVTELSAGQHRITVFHPALGEREQMVDVRPNSTQQIVIDLAASDSATSSRQ